MIPVGSVGSSLTIDEFSGSRNWSLTLIGAGLPHQGAGWGTENRIPTDFYPGNFARGTQQVIGPKEPPSHWNGIWRRTLLSRSPATITPGGQSQQTGTPSDLADFFDQLVLGGALLQVTWTATKYEYDHGQQGAAQSYQIVRQGRVKKFEYFPLTLDDWKWEVEWTWVGRGGSQQKAVSARDSDSSSAAAAVQAAITDALEDTGDTSDDAADDPLVPFSALPTTLGLYETLGAGFFGLSFGFNASLVTLQASFGLSVSLGFSATVSTSQSAGSLLSVSVDCTDTCDAFTDSVGEMPFEVMSASDDASDQCYAAAAAATQVAAAWNVAQAAQAAAAKARILASQNPGGGAKGAQQTSSTGAGQTLGAWTTRAGDTPMSVARKWYGNPDRALELLQANHLPLGTPSFVPGTVLMVPILGSPSAS